jgi:hypothetical protein
MFNLTPDNGNTPISKFTVSHHSSDYEFKEEEKNNPAPNSSTTEPTHAKGTKESQLFP